MAEEQSLADRVRQLANNAALYRETDPDPDAQIVATAAEIDSNMTYLGLDDVIVQLASEVEALENTLRDVLLPVEVLKPIPGDIILFKLPKATDHSVFHGIQEFMQKRFPHNTIILAHEDADIAIFPPSQYTERELLLRNADAWEVFLGLSQRAEAEWGDESPEWLDLWISRLEFALKGDPGCDRARPATPVGAVADHGGSGGVTSKEWRDKSREEERRSHDRYLAHFPEIRVFDDHVEMTQRDVDRLDEYSTSVPTGVYLGKCWKAVFPDGVWLRWYGWPSKEAKAGMASINSRRIKIVTTAQRIALDELRRLEGEEVGQEAA
jgi:hypothetical protein